ncbi:transposase [Candidatus Daviesbacteria bacterium]|nr:transposase [Candidatus Daviesbacteria bacterium]
MPQRPVVLANNEIYHVFNRTIGGQQIFAQNQKFNLSKALEIVNYYRFTQKIRLSRFKQLPAELKKQYLDALASTDPLVEIYAFAFMPNHFHFLLKQIRDNGVAAFISNFQNSFAKVFNLKNNRNGALFQNAFKAKRIVSDEQFVHISRYIHLNPVTAYIIEFDKLANFKWTSFSAYVTQEQIPLINSDFLVQMFGSKEKYVNFVADQIDYQRDLAQIKDLLIEE